MDDQAGVDVAQGMRAACPNCHYEQQLGISIGSLTAVGNSMNIAVTCPICRTTFDATGGGDGTFEPDWRGRLRLRQAVFDATTAIVSRPVPRPEMVAAIEALTMPAEAGAPPQAVQAVAGFALLWKWLNDNPAFAAIVIPLLIFALERAYATPEPAPVPPPAVEVTVVQPPNDRSELVEELRRIVEQAIEEQQGTNPPPVGPEPPGTGAP